MIWLRTVILFDKGDIISGVDWETIHASYIRAIQKIDHPAGSGKLTVRKKHKKENGQWARNGVGFLKQRFLSHMVDDEKWAKEVSPDIILDESDPILLFPSKEPYKVPPANFGGFDFFTTTQNGLRVALEWETGNVSSSHRSMNKMAIALSTKAIDAGVLIVPSRELYKNLTDRIGNFEELRGYLRFWQGLGKGVDKGLLAISVVEHDEVTTRPDIPFLFMGDDGNAKQALGSETPDEPDLLEPSQ